MHQLPQLLHKVKILFFLLTETASQYLHRAPLDFLAAIFSTRSVQDAYKYTPGNGIKYWTSIVERLIFQENVYCKLNVMGPLPGLRNNSHGGMVKQLMKDWESFLHTITICTSCNMMMVMIFYSFAFGFNYF